MLAIMRPPVFSLLLGSKSITCLCILCMCIQTSIETYDEKLYIYIYIVYEQWKKLNFETLDTFGHTYWFLRDCDFFQIHRYFLR